MLLSRLNKESYENLLRTLIYANNNAINAENHSVVDDIIIQPGSTVLSYLNAIQYYIDRLQALDASTIETDTDLRNTLKEFLNYTEDQLTQGIEEDFDAIADNYFLQRIEAIAARGYCRFYASTNAAVTVAVNTEVTTRGISTALVYKTINEIDSLTPAYDSTTGRYFIDVAVECTTSGTVGNIQANRISSLVGVVTGIVAVNNIASTSGGKEEETNIELVERIKIRRAGRNLPTLPGYENLVISTGLILDTYITTKDVDSNLVIRPQSNALDIFVVTSPNIATAEETITTNEAYYLAKTRYDEGEQLVFPPSVSPEGSQDIILLNQPVIRLLGVYKDAAPDATATLIKDTSGVSNSVMARDAVRVALDGITSIRVIYEYDASVRSVQNVLDLPVNKVINSDVLVRLGEEVAIDFDIQRMQILPGYVLDDVKNMIEADLEKFFTGGTTSYGEVISPKVFATQVEYSDILRIALNVEGVDRIDTEFFEVSISGIPITTYVVLNVTQYPRLGTVTWS